jgi:hypothetical protein
MSYSRTEPFCDWLDVTCHPENTFMKDVVMFLAYHCFPVSFSSDKSQGPSTAYSVGDGLLVLDVSKRFHRASASGGAIKELVSLGLLRDYINIIGSVGHNITRLDVAVDIDTDCPPFLRKLESTYPNDIFSFGRKSLKVTRLYSARRSDLALTGTWYAGHRTSARITARVYDKQHELFEKKGLTIPPTTRIELTFRKDHKCSLYDVLMPKSLFYTHTENKILNKPEGEYIPDWSVKGLVPWVSEAKDYTLTIERFDNRVASSPELIELAKLGAQFGDAGQAVILRHFEKTLREITKTSRVSAPEDTEEGK